MRFNKTNQCAKSRLKKNHDRSGIIGKEQKRILITLIRSFILIEYDLQGGLVYSSGEESLGPYLNILS